MINNIFLINSIYKYLILSKFNITKKEILYIKIFFDKYLILNKINFYYK